MISENLPGKGSTFYFTLQLEVVKDHINEVDPPSTLTIPVPITPSKMSIDNIPPRNLSILFALIVIEHIITRGASLAFSGSYTAPLIVIDILIVEDNVLNQKVLNMMLVKLGHSVTLANSGSDALALLAENKKRFDIILMDIMMPIMDGLQTTREVCGW